MRFDQVKSYSPICSLHLGPHFFIMYIVLILSKAIPPTIENKTPSPRAWSKGAVATPPMQAKMFRTKFWTATADDDL